MLKVEEDYSLKSLNTFGINCNSQFFTTISRQEDLLELGQTQYSKLGRKFVLGGGSNVLFTKDIVGVTVLIRLMGIEIVDENHRDVLVRAGAGERWHDLVMFCVNHGWAGVENLSLIPGCVGAAPMQNIGAYGAELKDVFYSLTYHEYGSEKERVFYAPDCHFGYRESIFKRELKDKGIITSVTLKLAKNPQLNTTYGAINQELLAMGISKPSIADVSNAVIRIRTSKLPNPAELGNAGSFFKNPVVSEDHFNRIRAEFPQVVGYPGKTGEVKLAAGWLIEQCGWKGKVVGSCGVHRLQALVLVNHGGATGNEVFELSSAIIADVKARFDVDLEREVNIL